MTIAARLSDALGLVGLGIAVNLLASLGLSMCIACPPAFLTAAPLHLFLCFSIALLPLPYTRAYNFFAPFLNLTFLGLLYFFLERFNVTFFIPHHYIFLNLLIILSAEFSQLHFLATSSAAYMPLSNASCWFSYT